MSVITQAERDIATRRVMKALAKRGGRHKHAKDEYGNIPIVIAFPRESVEEVFSRAAEVGETVNVALCYAKEFQMIKVEPYDPGEGTTDDINSTLSMGMLAIQARGRRGPHSYALRGSSVSSSQALQYA